MAYVSILRLTDEQIRAAIGQSEQEDAAYETEYDEVIDVHSDSESDHESADEYESDDADYDEEGSEAEQQTFTGRDGTIWLDSPHPKRRAPRFPVQRSMNKVNLVPGHKIETVEQSFDSIFTPDVINVIVKFTNIEAKKSKPEWKDVDAIELRAFIGLLMAAGVERASKRNYVEFYDQLRRPTNFSCYYGFESIQINFTVHTI